MQTKKQGSFTARMLSTASVVCPKPTQSNYMTLVLYYNSKKNRCTKWPIVLRYDCIYTEQVHPFFIDFLETLENRISIKHLSTLHNSVYRHSFCFRFTELPKISLDVRKHLLLVSHPPTQLAQLNTSLLCVPPLATEPSRRLLHLFGTVCQSQYGHRHHCKFFAAD